MFALQIESAGLFKFSGDLPLGKITALQDFQDPFLDGIVYVRLYERNIHLLPYFMPPWPSNPWQSLGFRVYSPQQALGEIIHFPVIAGIAKWHLT